MLKKRILLIFEVILSFAIAGCKEEESIGKNEKVIKNNWNESSIFESGGYTMIGEEGRLGFIYDDSEVVRFYLIKSKSTCGIFGGKNKS
ncbi:uncharacterized conserved protein [Solibacillus silvestris StLB046]|uniref:Uncharacterized conserved protein n=1 Tax=Solibacillus silvestris (strain StLB046) TaxID=1002809 RepID=F2FAG4_SOLSS|nr:hypothetical protein [Solibacillus silvestris]BAK16731.1 uncharacterized conserved protein [Solibacillus silvestris StLB046]